MKILLALLLLCVASCDAGPQQKAQEQAATNTAAKLPDYKVLSGYNNAPALQPDTNKRIKDLPNESAVWIEPWVMWGNADGQWFINGEFGYSIEKPNKDYIKIVRNGEGFTVDIDESAFLWSKCEIHGLGTGSQWIAVDASN